MSKQALPLLGGISAEQFLAEYWQQKPLLIRGALPDFQSPVTPEDLAGLSLEEDVESRIIIEQRIKDHWILERGPFNESTFEQLSDLNWTLLIQQLDAWVPEVHELKRQFRFIPDWRVDDVMASFAPKGGSVGPHFDFYDVFLVQAYGERRWKLGQWCDQNTNTRNDTSLSILNSFETSDEWVLQPGDILYVPPKLAHFGVAENDCITLSVGFRAPRKLELLSSFTDFLCEHQSASNNAFFGDPARKPVTHAASIDKNDRHALKKLMLSALDDSETFDQWLGSYLSEPKNTATLLPLEEELDLQEVQQYLKEASVIYKNEGSRFLFIEAEDTVLFFADGHHWALDSADFTFVQYLCKEDEYDAQTLLTFCNKVESEVLIAKLLENGSIQVEYNE
jgi:50S ribosomal protein L16 3-hydroxylase